MRIVTEQVKGGLHVLHEIWNFFLGSAPMWWNNLSGHFTITPVGVALANAYIRGKDPSVPSLY